MAEIAECVDVGTEDIAALARFAAENRIDLTVVGPESSLTLGIVDAFQERGLKIFGPTMKGAQIEGSKVFAKKLMYRHAIPTATFRVFDSRAEAHRYVDAAPGPLVVKADGLAAGKGVLVTSTAEEAHEGIDIIMKERLFGNAGNQIIIEERLTGQEASVIAFTDGRTVVPLLPAQDHKRIHDGDRGPNTGGMGAYAPAPVVTPALAREIERRILVPVVHALNREGTEYRGVIYVGIMIPPGGPAVLEFNCRFGDPETQPVMLLMKSDIVPILLATVEGKLEDVELEWRQGAAVCVVAASGGYPGKYEKGKPIRGLESLKGDPNVQVFHAGTEVRDGEIVTSGGRVLGVTARGSDIQSARKTAYEAIRKVGFEGAYWRRDIAARAFA
jgi:phosphoribosylamine--glycine ligase